LFAPAAWVAELPQSAAADRVLAVSTAAVLVHPPSAVLAASSQHACSVLASFATGSSANNTRPVPAKRKSPNMLVKSTFFIIFSFFVCACYVYLDQI
jgi:preprotein translocase subunit SecG